MMRSKPIRRVRLTPYRGGRKDEPRFELTLWDTNCFDVYGRRRLRYQLVVFDGSIPTIIFDGDDFHCSLPIDSDKVVVDVARFLTKLRVPLCLGRSMLCPGNASQRNFVERHGKALEAEVCRRFMRKE